MELGYDGKLYILAFDHRGSFQKKMFGIEGDPTDEQTEQIADAKHLIFEGLLKASEQGAKPEVTGLGHRRYVPDGAPGRNGWGADVASGTAQAPVAQWIERLTSDQ